jgi:hypothetical protein
LNWAVSSPGRFARASRKAFSASSETLLLQVALAELEQEALALDLPRQRVLQDRLRLVEPPGAHFEIGELPQHPPVARIERARALEARARVVEPALVLVRERQPERRLLVLGIERQRPLVGQDRVREALGLPVEVPEQHVALEDLGILGERLPPSRSPRRSAPAEAVLACLSRL